MRIIPALICMGIAAVLLQQPALAQRAGGGHRGGGDGAGINYAPQAAVYEVLAVDSGNRAVRMRAADGRTGDVHVGQGVYDLSRLKAGDKVRVDFLVPDSGNPKLSAASIWPAQ